MRTVNLVIPIEIPDEGDELFLIQSLMDVTRSEEREVYLDETFQKVARMTLRYDKWEFANAQENT